MGMAGEWGACKQVRKTEVLTDKPVCEADRLRGHPGLVACHLWVQEGDIVRLLRDAQGVSFPSGSQLLMFCCAISYILIAPPLPRSRRVPSRSGDPQEHNWDRPPPKAIGIYV